MARGAEEQPPQTGGENVGVEEDVASHGGEGERAAQASPPIGQDAEPGQTQVPAPEDDAGVPPDEEKNRPDG
jgi:hypothetical protein